MKRFRWAAVGTVVLLAGVVGLLVWQPWDAGSASPVAPTDDDPSGTQTTVQPVDPEDGIAVSTVEDDGDGSLRSAIVAANAGGKPTLITFDNSAGTFDEPQVIELESPLPEITGEVIVDGYIPDRLWQAIGITLSGADRNRVFTVADGGSLTLRSLTVADGAADEGAGVLNRGALVLDSVTMMNNAADGLGGAVLNAGGAVTVFNATFVDNVADRGGGLANVSGRASVVNSTFSGNVADDRGGGLYNEDRLFVANTILAASGGQDCVSMVAPEEASANNLIEDNAGCGTPISTADPLLEVLGYFNGPTMTLPLRSGSPAINLGDNSLAVDAFGQPLVWDQRGNGDPRFVAGFTDIGAFEHQAFPDLTVDTVEDVTLRSCSAVLVGDCPLRAAIELANATPESDVVLFDATVFSERATIEIDIPLPEVTHDLVLDASAGAQVTVRVPGGVRPVEGAALDLVNIVVD